MLLTPGVCVCSRSQVRLALCRHRRTVRSRDEAGESSEPRKSATLAISSGSAMRPIGTVDTMRAMASGRLERHLRRDDRPGLRTFERMRRSFSSAVQVRTNERIAALLAA